MRSGVVWDLAFLYKRQILTSQKVAAWLFSSAARTIALLKHVRFATACGGILWGDTVPKRRFEKIKRAGQKFAQPCFGTGIARLNGTLVSVLLLSIVEESASCAKQTQASSSENFQKRSILSV